MPSHRKYKQNQVLSNTPDNSVADFSSLGDPRPDHCSMWIKKNLCTFPKVESVFFFVEFVFIFVSLELQVCQTVASCHDTPLWVFAHASFQDLRLKPSHVQKRELARLRSHRSLSDRSPNRGKSSLL